MKLPYILFLLILPSLLVAQHADYQKPKLVIGITVEGLTADYLSMFWNGMGRGGFRKVIDNGAVFSALQFAYEATDNLSDIATFSTGAQPYFHGISWSDVYNRNTRKQQFVLHDELESPINGVERLSARNLLVTTLADELKVHSIQRSKVISIAMNAKESMMQTGHIGDAVVWVDNATGKWSSTSYYTAKLPAWVERKNQQNSIQDYMQMVWEPLYPINYYYVTQSRGYTSKSFSYPLKKIATGKTAFEEFKKTPFANTMIREMAVEAIEQEALGRDIFPDLLLLYFNLQSYPQADDLTVELEDSYLRLDNEIKMIIEAAERRVGKDNLLVYVTSPRKTHYAVSPILKEKMQLGTFNSHRYMALLNSYLMAIYGQESWVLACSNGNIYLNRKKIDEKNLSLKDFQERAMEFVSQIPGVMNVVNSIALEQQFALRNTLRLSYNKQNSGDILFSLQPGWIEVDRNDKPTGFYNVIGNSVPFYVYGWKIAPQKYATTYSVVDATATLASWLHIPLPNASNGVLLPIVLSTE
jgi:hypothetical protein